MMQGIAHDETLPVAAAEIELTTLVTELAREDTEVSNDEDTEDPFEVADPADVAAAAALLAVVDEVELDKSG